MRQWIRNVAVGVAAAAMSLAAVFCLPAAPTLAQSTRTLTVPADTKAVVHVNLDALKKTQAGAAIFKMARDQATEALAEASRESETAAANDPNAPQVPDIEKVKEILGFDPFDDLHGITMIVNDYENPEAGAAGIIELGKTTGNLEGLIVTLPGYEASDFGAYRIHSVAPDVETRGYGAIHTDASGTKRIVAAMDRAAVERMLNDLDGKVAAGGGMKTVTLGGGSGTFVNVEVMELPIEQMGEGPHSNIARMLRSVSVSMADDGENYTLDVALTTMDAVQAEQLRQLVQGGIAAMQLAAGTEAAEDPDFQQVMKVMQGLTVGVDGDRMTLNLKASTAMVNEFLRNEADLPIE